MLVGIKLLLFSEKQFWKWKKGMCHFSFFKYIYIKCQAKIILKNNVLKKSNGKKKQKQKNKLWNVLMNLEYSTLDVDRQVSLIFFL